jgi:hypothetical protein
MAYISNYLQARIEEETRQFWEEVALFGSVAAREEAYAEAAAAAEAARAEAAAARAEAAAAAEPGTPVNENRINNSNPEDPTTEGGSCKRKSNKSRKTRKHKKTRKYKGRRRGTHRKN